MEKRYIMAGVSTLNGVVKIRFAGDHDRIKVLEKNGHKDIDLIDLPYAMTKAEAGDYLTTIDFANGREEVERVIADLVSKNPLKPTTEEKTETVEEVV